MRVLYHVKPKSSSLLQYNWIMALKIFAKECTNNHPPTQWLVNVNRKTGVFYLNNLIADDLGLEKGGKGLLAYDDETKEWLVAFGDDLPGFSLRKLSNHDYKDRLCFARAKAVHTILNEIKAQRAATFVISKRPKVIDGRNWYRILTKKPQRIN